jgi:glycogen(starch) synthase
LERLQATRSSFVISPSAALAQRVTADWGLDPERVAVVPTGIAPLRPDAANASLAAQLPKPFVLYFGRLELRKGTREWLDALPVVLARNPGLTALFVGEDMGWRGRSFRDYAKRISGPLWPRFRFHTHLAQTELFPVIANATLVVLPSRWESLSNACLESMSLARPILATRGSAFEELIEHGVSGFLVAPRDPSALAEAACSLLAQPSLLARLGAAAQRRAREFDLEAMVAELVQVYERVAGGWTA